MNIDQAKFNGIFSFVHSDKVNVHTVSVMFLCLMLVSAIALVGIFAFYWVKLRNLDDDGDSEESLAQYIK